MYGFVSFFVFDSGQQYFNTKQHRISDKDIDVNGNSRCFCVYHLRVMVRVCVYVCMCVCVYVYVRGVCLCVCVFGFVAFIPFLSSRLFPPPPAYIYHLR